jgi:hypothetical protein
MLKETGRRKVEDRHDRWANPISGSKKKFYHGK